MQRLRMVKAEYLEGRVFTLLEVDLLYALLCKSVIGLDVN